MGRKTLAETQEVKQVGVEVELLKDSQSDVVADTHETPKTLAEKPVELWSLLPVFIAWSTTISGKDIFGKAIYDKAISGKAIYGK